jgi:cell division protein FtsQ
MHQLIDKKYKIIAYILLLVTLSTVSVKYDQNKRYFFSVMRVDVKGLSSNENLQISKKINNILYKNIFTINKEELKKVFDKHNIIEEYNIKKIYPSLIQISIKPTKFVARISDAHQMLVGTNGKLIKNKVYDKKLPYIFGEFKTEDFLIFKKNIDNSKFNFSELKMLYFFPLGRWDILTIDDILIKLPQDNLLQSINLAHKMISNDYLKGRNLIDLRVSNQLIVN